jgi:hypothetical protein
MAVLTFPTFVLLGNTLTRRKVFTCIALFNVIQVGEEQPHTHHLASSSSSLPQMSMGLLFSHGVESMAEGLVTLSRIQAFLQLKSASSTAACTAGCTADESAVGKGGGRRGGKGVKGGLKGVEGDDGEEDGKYEMAHSDMAHVALSDAPVVAVPVVYVPAVPKAPAVAVALSNLVCRWAHDDATPADGTSPVINNISLSIERGELLVVHTFCTMHLLCTVCALSVHSLCTLYALSMHSLCTLYALTMHSL